MSHPSPDQSAADAQYYRGVLHELIDLGMGLAREVRQQAPGADAIVAFDRIARTVRRSIALARRVAEPASAALQHAAARRQVIRAVEDAIQARAGGVDAERLHAEFLDRLDAPELQDEIDHRPVAEIVADICRDLGLAAPEGAQPWKRRTPADVAALWARAAAPAWAALDPPADPAVSAPIACHARFRGS